MSTEAVYFQVVPYVEADRSEAFAIQRTRYFVSDGHVFSRELVSFHTTRSEADANVGHHTIAAVREP